MTVSDGDDVGWDVGGHITGLGLNDWEGSQGTSSEIVRDLGCTLQQTGVEVENITGVGLNYALELIFEISLKTENPDKFIQIDSSSQIYPEKKYLDKFIQIGFSR